MKPIEVIVYGATEKTSPEICSIILDMNRWSEFKGYFILPGIKNAGFEVKTPDIIGTRIKVENLDGSSHIEEIIEWDTNSKIVLKFQNFTAPVKYLATQFIEVWKFKKSDNGTEITRIMTMYPKGFLARLLLLPISRLMKKALEQNLCDLG